MHDLSYLHNILILLVASVAIIIIFKQLRLSPALGYLIAGAAIGPFGFAILESDDTTKSIAELGIVFLLFAIGLELSFSRLMEMKKYVFGFGGLQIIITGIVMSYLSFVGLNIPIAIAILIGSALALSSTAIVLQVIAENGEQSTRVGRLSFSTLLMQDLAVIPILVLLPIIKQSDISIFSALTKAFINAIIAMVIIFIVGRSLLRPLYKMIADTKSNVLFLSFTLIIILGAAYMSHNMGLSFALGAFIAGLMVAETEYRYRVEEEINSLKHLLMGLFFLTIGMSFDFDLMIRNLPWIILASFTLISFKAIIIVTLCRIFNFPLGSSIHAGLLLAQGGEFAFVVLLMSVNSNLINTSTSQFLMTVITLTMALTPLLSSIGRQIKTYLYTKEVLQDSKIKREIGNIKNHVIIIGFSRIGRIITHILRKQNIRYLILDNNHRMVRMEKNKGYNIIYGDAMNKDVLTHVGTEKCDSVIVAMDDEISCIKITRFIHLHFPNASVITKSETINNTQRFKKFGASFVISKNLETAIQMSNAAMLSVGLENQEINNALDLFRDNSADFLKDILQSEKQEGNLDLFDKIKTNKSLKKIKKQKDFKSNTKSNL